MHVQICRPKHHPEQLELAFVMSGHLSCQGNMEDAIRALVT